MAGPVPTRVDGGVKAGLLELVDHVTGKGGVLMSVILAGARTYEA